MLVLHPVNLSLLRSSFSEVCFCVNVSTVESLLFSHPLVSMLRLYSYGMLPADALVRDYQRGKVPLRFGRLEGYHGKREGLDSENSGVCVCVCRV